MNRSKVRTGDVFQIRKNGRNYVALGKVEKRRTGEIFIAATLNGNINPDGTFKRKTGTSKGKIKLLRGNEIERIHQNRVVDISSIANVHSRLATKLQRTNGRNGVVTVGHNVPQTIRELKASLN